MPDDEVEIGDGLCGPTLLDRRAFAPELPADPTPPAREIPLVQATGAVEAAQSPFQGPQLH